MRTNSVPMKITAGWLSRQADSGRTAFAPSPDSRRCTSCSNDDVSGAKLVRESSAMPQDAIADPCLADQERTMMVLMIGRVNKQL